ncbi:MAG: aminoglycoside phosphotransferase family protein, partial [Prosthecobacter sp.]|nr:aminoglycoside phosphotransferase family protein [Prosthecobacter sp.]
MKFFIIENRRGELNILISALKTSFPDSILQTEGSAIIDQWSKAEELLNLSDDTADQVIFCDFALDDDGSSDANAGLKRVQELMAARSQATWIAYTKFRDIFEHDEAKTMFHAILSKQELSQHESLRDRAVFVEQVVRRALGRRQGASPVLHDVEDSLGMRIFYASFSSETLDDLLNAECAGWCDIKVRALSSGYSGSSLLNVTGLKNNEVKGSIVVKIAPKAELIERETKIIDSEDYKGEFEDFGRLCARGRPVKPLPGARAYYSIQEAIPGPTLGNILRNSAADIDKYFPKIQTIIDVQLAQSERGRMLSHSEDSQKNTRLELSAIDLHRARKSCDLLSDMAVILEQEGTWPSLAPDPKKLFARIHYVTTNWKGFISSIPPLLWVIQHGDLNPENVILGSAGQITFIDLARLDRWPVGYDLIRLSIQMRIRFVDGASGRDWISNLLSDWCKFPIMEIDRTIDPGLSLCPASALCERELSLWISRQEQSDIILKGVLLCALLDLTRIISYADLAPMKRL